ncbi:50S ribosomal protein L19 [Holospora undulata HU1]|uniref:Large ribosomal subunit protein bL19 n=2 Tax=Holospora TaxID=44747 RepID=A0A061JIA9_9PROT|nr:50S ribosomal protein L19 [Holospora undulata HU1]
MDEITIYRYRNFPNYFYLWHREIFYDRLLAIVVPSLVSMNLLEQFNQKKVAELMEGKQPIPEFSPGDTLSVHVILSEGGRVRVQRFEGVCIARRNRGLHSSFVVRRVVGNVSIKRRFPLYSPVIESIQVLRRGVVRRAKLYYLEGLSGKSSRIKERRRPNTGTDSSKK